MKDGEIPGGSSDGGYNKLISQEDATADEQALYSIQEKQQGTDHTIWIQKRKYLQLHCQWIQ